MRARKPLPGLFKIQHVARPASVELERNDLSRLCRPGTVHVPELTGLRSFATVHHLVACVRGRLHEGVDAASLLPATFPGGSITGAPKIRAMQILREAMNNTTPKKPAKAKTKA